MAGNCLKCKNATVPNPLPGVRLPDTVRGCLYGERQDTCGHYEPIEPETQPKRK